MFTNIDEAAKGMVEFCEQDGKKRSVVLILSEQENEEDVSTVVSINGTSGLVKGSIATALAKNSDLRGLVMDAFASSIAKIIIRGVVPEDAKEETKESKEEK